MFLRWNSGDHLIEAMLEMFENIRTTGKQQLVMINTMPKKFFCDKDVQELKSNLQAIIEVVREDNLKTHLRQAIHFKDSGKISGAISQDHFKIWIQEQTGVTGVFYPVMQGQITPSGRGVEIVLKHKLNIVGRALFMVVVIVLALGIVTQIVIQENNEARFVIWRLLAGIVLFGLMISVPAFVYLRTQGLVKQYLIKELELRSKG
jgi:hypothetical protein